MLSDTWAGKLAICKINTEVIHTEDFDISILLSDHHAFLTVFIVGV